jgi:GNAT superfamily N-acetyltransferase
MSYELETRMTTEPVHIRRARAVDLPTLARFASAMAELHIGFDSRRFIVPDGGEAAFAEFFRLELDRPETVLLIAEDEQGTVGYAFVRMENASLEELRGPGAWLHDLYVKSGARGVGVGRLLVESAKDVAREFGSASLMLGMSPHNGPARRLFERLGFRPTMIEMRVEFNSERLD